MAKKTHAIASVGKGIQYSANFAFAYSGDTAVANSETTCLEFVSGKKTWLARWEMHYTTTGATPIISSDDMAWSIYFNGNLVIIINASSSSDAKQPDVELVIPPLTGVKITAENVNDASILRTFATLAGPLFDDK